MLYPFPSPNPNPNRNPTRKRLTLTLPTIEAYCHTLSAEEMQDVAVLAEDVACVDRALDGAAGPEDQQAGQATSQREGEGEEENVKIGKVNYLDTLALCTPLFAVYTYPPP